MMFTPDAPTYILDLGSGEGSLWREVIAGEHAVARQLANEAMAEFERTPETARWVFEKLYKASGGLYQGEINSWAKALGVSTGTATLLNCTYELSHVSWKHAVAKVFGCTAGVRWVDGMGMAHVRNLDWPLANLGNATCVFRFRRGSREFVSVGIAGFVGVLSGMVPGRYSATINWAPPVTQPTFDFGPVFLLRQTLEECVSYDEAVDVLKHTPLATSVFFTVCGVERGQACVIERTQSQAVVREVGDSTITQANHFVTEEFANNNMELLDLDDESDESSYVYSQRRAEALESKLAGVDATHSLDTIATALDIEPTLNESTYQQMVFCPATGEVKVWRRLTT